MRRPDLTIDAELMTAHGAPLYALPRASTEADLLVLGHHTRPGPARLLSGDVASDLISLSACPVVLVPHLGLGP